MGIRLDQLLERAEALPALRRSASREPVAAKAEGARIYDVDNRGFVDYTGGGGTAMVGHGNRFVLDAVRKVLAAGVAGGLHHPLEVELGERLLRFLPWAGRLVFAPTPGDAMRAALAWARRRTGRDRVLALDGGAHDAVGEGRVRDVPGWDAVRIEAAITAGASKLAAFVVDPLMTGVGVIPPPEGLLARLAAVCRRHGVVFILDERVTGFRLARGGAAEWAGVEPDVAVYGGALGGGFPIGVVALRGGADEDEEEAGPLAPPPPPASLAAAEAVLSILTNDAVYERLEERTAQLVEGILQLAGRFSRPITINAVGSVFALYMSREPVTCAADSRAADGAAYARLRTGLLEEGVLLPPDQGTPAFLSHAHAAKDVEETLAAFERVLLRLHQEDMP